jgi:ADP-ribose pyrophosphatase YjhB (NUDIX family)
MLMLKGMMNMELVYKNTRVRILSSDISKLKVDALVIPATIGLTTDDKIKNLLAHDKRRRRPALFYASVAREDFNSDENIVRKAYASVLACAAKARCKSLAFVHPDWDKIRFPLKATAKIMAQEVLKHIRQEAIVLPDIIFAISKKSEQGRWQKIVFSYMNYIIHKLSQGPFSTVDIIIESADMGIVLIERSNPPFGWALPGGFVDYGESLEKAALREAKEETNLDVFDLKQFHVYSQPGRDPRFHTIATVFSAKAKGAIKARSDAQDIGIFYFAQIKKMKLAFDHNQVIEDYFNLCKQKHNYPVFR